jgi:hypothetical protein
MVSGVIAIKSGAVGKVELSRSAEPDLDVEARFPCLLSRSREDANMDDVVDMLKV